MPLHAQRHCAGGHQQHTPTIEAKPVNTNPSPAKAPCPKPLAGRLTTACAAALLALLMLLGLPQPAAAQVEDYLYTTNDGSITITAYIGPGGAVTIPSEINGLPVTSISACAGRSLTSVTIPDSVTSIGAYAFSWSTSLTNVTIPDSVTNIGSSAFKDCGSLTSVALPNGVTIIAQETFYYCTSLETITVGVNLASIDYCAFFCCIGLRGVYFRGNAPSIDPTAFNYATGVTFYRLPGTIGWDLGSGGPQTVLWFLPNPVILDRSPSFGVHTNRFGFIISWATNLPIVVEACTNMANAAWSPVGTNTLIDGSSYFNDPQWKNYPARFYRLRSP